MDDFGAAIGLSLATEGLPIAGLTGGLGAALAGGAIVWAFCSLFQARFHGEAASRRTGRRN